MIPYIKHKLCSTSLSRIYQGVDFDKTQVYAIKIYKYDKFFHSSSEQTQSIIDISQKIDSLCTINYIIHNQNIYMESLYLGNNAIVMEYIDGIDLEKYMLNNNYDSNEIIHIIKLILHSLKTIHYHGFMHRDIKLENIMLIFDENKQITSIKIIDLGYMTNDVISTEDVGTPCYIAPEVAKQECYNQKADVYSFAVLLYRLVEKQDLFYTIYPENEPFLRQWRKIQAGYQQFLPTVCYHPYWKEAPILYQLFENCIKNNPQERFTSQQAYDHLWTDQ